MITLSFDVKKDAKGKYLKVKLNRGTFGFSREFDETTIREIIEAAIPTILEEINNAI